MWFKSRPVKFWLALLVTVAGLLAPVGHAQSTLPAFPGAQGFGSKTRHAYAGGAAPTVYRVTNLNDSGAGSLRAALTAAGPRIVIFEVSGLHFSFFEHRN